MKKKMLLVLCFAVVILVVGRNALASAVISGGFRAVTGLRMGMKLNLGLFNSSVSVKELKLYNPDGFPDKVMLEMPEIHVKYNPVAIFSGTVHLREVRLHVEEFLVERNEKGKLNLDSLKFVQRSKKEPPKKKPAATAQRGGFRLDTLDLKIDRVIFKDYSKGMPPRVEEFRLALNERYENIWSLEAVASIILVKAVANTAITRLTGFNVGPLIGSVEDTLKEATSMATDAIGLGFEAGSKTLDATKDAAGKTAETLKKILPVSKTDK
ncbi:MAG: hypothetical protein NC819_02200 [Candidatus Omnitrophica bacterium]|nr:hypothetical protein [Candidatus Omnitrophota bacterium]